MNILIVNGANMKSLEKRGAMYGGLTLQEMNQKIIEKVNSKKVTLEFFVSNSEGEIIDRLQMQNFDALVINPAAYSHYSYAIFDALSMLACKKIEVHLSNIHAREEFRKTSITAAACDAVISGLGYHGYIAAIEHLIMHYELIEYL